MIISEKQILQLINVIYEYRTWLIYKGEPFDHINEILNKIQNQQSPELKVISNFTEDPEDCDHSSLEETELPKCFICGEVFP